MSHLIFVTGGARSGKSAFAENRAAQTGQAVTYLATAQAFDDEMRVRIQRHQHDRPAEWPTLEEPLHLCAALEQVQTPTLLLDCLSLWVNNQLMTDATDAQILAQMDDFLIKLRGREGTSILVTNEVGLGIVPADPLTRRYRDVLGWVNQRAGAAADEAYLLVSGLSVTLKG